MVKFLKSITISFLLLFLSHSFAFSLTKNWCEEKKPMEKDNQPFPVYSKGNFNFCSKGFKSIKLNKVKEYFSRGDGKLFLCRILETNDFSNERLQTYYQLALEIKLDCKYEKSLNKNLKTIETKTEDYVPSKISSWNKIGELEPLRCYDIKSKKVYIIPAEGVNTQGRHSATKKCMGNAYRISEKDYEKLVPKQNTYENDKVICYKATDGWSGKWSESNLKYVKKAKSLSLSCGIISETKQIIIKEDTISKELAEQRALELEEERNRLKAMEIERKRLEEKTKQLAEQNRIAELNAKKRSEEIAKEVASQERKKFEEERALRRAEEKARKIAQEKAKQLASERKKAEKVAKQLERERVLAEEKNKERLKKLDEERKIAEQKARELEKSQQTQLASIQEEKKKREELEKKLAELREQNKNQKSKTGKIKTVKLPPEWMPHSNDIIVQQKQFCQLTNNFFKDMDKAISSRNEIRINMVHRDRQENLDGLLPSGKFNNWIFKVLKIDQVEDGSAAVVLSLQCKSFVGSGQVYTKETWRKKSNKEWRATIPYNDRRFRELAKLGVNDFILGSGTLLEIEAFKPGQIETFYASQQIGEHPLTKGLNLEGELFIADLSYIAALN